MTAISAFVASAFSISARSKSQKWRRLGNWVTVSKLACRQICSCARFSRVASENSATYLTSPAPPSTLLMLTRARNGSSSLRESHNSPLQWPVARRERAAPARTPMLRRVEKRRVILWPRASSAENPVSTANARLTSTMIRLASKIAMPSELFS